MSSPCRSQLIKMTLILKLDEMTDLCIKLQWSKLMNTLVNIVTQSRVSNRPLIS